MINPKKIKKIWIIGVSTIGDMVINIPLFKLARQTFPNAKIYFISWTYVGLKLIEKCPYIDGIITESPSANLRNKIKFIFRIFRERFDVTLTPRGFNLGFLVSIFSGARYRVWFVENRYSFDKTIPFGKLVSNIRVKYKYSRFLSDKRNNEYDCVKFIQEILNPFRKDRRFIENLELFIDYKKEQDYMDTLLRKEKIATEEKVICVHLGWMKENRKRCREREKRIQVFEFIVKNYHAKICFIGWEDNSAEVKAISHALWNNRQIIDFTKKLSLSQSTYLISKCSLFLCTDSWPMHIAIWLNKRVIAILGPITHVIDKHIYYPIRKEKISDITIEEVISAIKKSL